MPADDIALELKSERPAPFAFNLRNVAIFLWVGLTLVCTIRAIREPAKHTVYPIYSHAGGEWLAGRDSYSLAPNFDVYRYSPPMTALFAAMHPLGDRWGGALWRVVGAIMLAGGLLAFTRHTLPRPLPTWQTALLFLIVWPLLLQNLNNGQANPHLLALLLFGMADLSRGRLWRSAAMFALAILIKPYVLALVGLVILVEPRLCLRLMVMLAIGLALPFAAQLPQYVIEQYRNYAHNLEGNDRSGQDLRNVYRDVQMLFRVYLTPLSSIWYHAIEFASGLAMAGLIVAGRMHGKPRTELLCWAFALASCWMTALGPATESCTYLLIGPTLGLAVLSSTGRAGRGARVAAGLLIGIVVASSFPKDWQVQVLGPQPIGALIILSLTVSECLRQLRKTPAKISLKVAA